MSGLQETFYIMGMVFMSVTFIILLALVTAVFVIRSKIARIHAMVEERINTVATLAEKGEAVIATAKKVLKHER